MSLFNALLGNAHAVDVNDIAKDYLQLLAPGEKPLRGYKLVRDVFIFTDKRLLMIDKQGLTGRKIDYHSIPYRSISHYSVETAGHFDLDAELKIWVAGSDAPITKTFSKAVNIYEVQAVLTEAVCR